MFRTRYLDYAALTQQLATWEKKNPGLVRVSSLGKSAEGRTMLKVKKSYRGKASWMPYVELAFGGYFTWAVWFAWDNSVYTSLPFLVLFQLGFLYVGVSSLLQAWGLSGNRSEALVATSVEAPTA